MSMPQEMLVYGNWRVRHAEPLTENQALLRLHRVPAGAESAGRSWQLDCRGELPVLARCSASGWQPLEAPTAVRCANVDPDWVPLARVQIQDGAMRITHLVDRADWHVAHFIQPPSPVAPFEPARLWQRLGEAFELNHLYTNNYECFYSVGGPAAPRYLEVDVQALDVLAIGELWLEHLESGAACVVPQIGEELQHGSHDNVLCDVLPNLEGLQGWANAALFSRKRRARVLEPLAEFRAVLFDRDGGRHEHCHADEFCGQAPEEAMALRLDLPLRTASRWRRTLFTAGCESAQSGHLFNVTFSLNQALGARAASVALCEIEYRKSRGHGNEKSIGAEIDELAHAVPAFLRRCGVTARVNALHGLEGLFQKLAASHSAKAQEGMIA